VSRLPPQFDARYPTPTSVGCALLFASTAILQAAFWAVGDALVVQPGGVQPLSPCQGVLFGLLLAAPRPTWPWLALGALAGQTGAALAFDAAAAPPLLHFGYAFVAVGEAVAGTVWLQQIFHGPELLLRMRNVIAFVILLAGVSCAGAGVATSLRLVATGEGGFADFQLWWTRDYLGMVLYTPIVVQLLQPTVLPPTFARIQRWEPPLQLAFLVAVTQVAFSGDGAPANLGQVPYIVYPVLVWIAFRGKPPSLVLVALLIAAYGAFLHTSAGRGPFAHAHYSAFESLISAQIYVVVTTVTMLLLAAAVYERRRALLAAHASDERYRTFVRGSHDAIWRVEIDPPLPLALPPAERARRLRDDARVAEHNDVYARMGAASPRVPRPWRDDAAWFEPCSEVLAAADAPARGNIEAKLRIGGASGRIVLCELHCVVESGALRRVWGAAMDITAQERSQHELEAQRAELSSLASQLMRAEANARRATAADLHDGIGQNLSAITMWQARVRESDDPHERSELLDHIHAAATESLQCTREIISDLSPPGLYDMGLDSALSALAGRTRQRHALDVALERCELPAGLGVDLKVTIFQCVRELLANVVKHARARRARIEVRHDAYAIWATVSDDGVGLDPESLRARPSTHGGYGLLMIRERLVAMGGMLAIERSDSGGAQVTITVPYAGGTG
jgi:signal transduction histidine kinase